MYYVMSIPEILTLLFILLLWILSIICFYKRYERLTTIERADIPNFKKQNANNASVGSTLSLNQKNKINSLNANLVNNNFGASSANSNNKLAAVNYESTKVNTNYSLINLNGINQSKDMNLVESTTLNNLDMVFSSSSRGNEKNSLEGFKTKYKQNCILLRQNALSYVPNYKNILVIDEVKNQEKNIFKSEILGSDQFSRYYYKKPNRLNQRFFSNPKYSSMHQANLLSPFYNHSVEKYPGKIFSQTLLNAFSSSNKLINENRIPKSNSEPVFQELVNTFSSKVYLATEKEPLLRTTSIGDNRDLKEENFKTTKNYSTQKSARPTESNKYYPHETNLLNPELIPKAIRKSLIDLHKKSIWNLSHRPQNASGAQLQNNTSLNINPIVTNATVSTQPRNRSEVKMKVIENFI